MRTTLTVDDDVAALIEKIRRKRDLSLRQIINEAIRLGLERMDQQPQRPFKRYRTKSVSLGRCRVTSLDDISEVLALGEGESFR